MMNLYNKRFSIVLALLILNFININLIIGHFTDKSGNYLSKDYYSKKICKKRWCKKCNKSKGYQGPIKELKKTSGWGWKGWYSYYTPKYSTTYSYPWYMEGYYYPWWYYGYYPYYYWWY